MKKYRRGLPTSRNGVRFSSRHKVKEAITTNERLLSLQQEEFVRWTQRIEELKQIKFDKVTQQATSEMIALRDYCIQKEQENTNQEIGFLVQHFQHRLRVALENLNVYSYQSNGGSFDSTIHQAFRSVPTMVKSNHYKIARSLKDGYHTFYESGNRQVKRILQYEVVEVYVYDKGGHQ